jgi:pimeloyl-ACP methyl ester carboxylesterase
MNKMERRLLKEGYKVVNVDYPSRKYEIKELSTLAIEKGLEGCKAYKPKKIHFVTHSLGGILIRQYLSKHKIEKLGRTVMLGPPNNGSEAVDKLKNVPGYKFINGPAGMQLGTGIQSIPQSLGEADFEVGIIAGTRSINLFLSMLIPSTDDGKVSIESAHLKNEKDFLSLPVSHPFLMKNDQVIENVVRFIKYGKFVKDQQ